MLSRIETLNYRALRYINQSLSDFQVLIGPNASGKSTFLDTIALVADIVTKPLADVIRDRVSDLRDLTWMRESDWFEVIVDAAIPLDLNSKYKTLRYEVRVGVDEKSQELALLTETLWFANIESNGSVTRQAQLFPVRPKPPERITLESNKRTPTGWRKIVSKSEGGNDYFRSETTDWNNLFRLGPQRSALANLPEDVQRFPVSTWFKRYISEGVQRITLNSEALRLPSPPQSPRAFLPDGSNLPWVINELEDKYPVRLIEWVNHLRTALPDIRAIRTVERPEDRHRYLVIEYDTGLVVPSWIVSDGTLRMLALTILAYLPNISGIYLIEEPENGIHPHAVEPVFQSLSSVYDAQVLLATHSPVVLSLAKPQQILCFARTAEGEVDIVRGDKHPRLADWQGETNLATLFAGGVLG